MDNASISKKRKLLLGIAAFLCIIAVIIFSLLLVTNKSAGLICVDEIEVKLAEAYKAIRGGHVDDYSGVHNFKIENVDEPTHDQTFSCTITGSKDSSTGYTVTGLIKNGQVIQLQSIFYCTSDLFNDLDSNSQDAVLLMSAFPLLIFDANANVATFLNNMEMVSATAGVYQLQKISGNIEYTYMDGKDIGLPMASFNIRYLPAFSSGFFEDDAR